MTHSIGRSVHFSTYKYNSYASHLLLPLWGRVSALNCASVGHRAASLVRRLRTLPSHRTCIGFGDSVLFRCLCLWLAVGGIIGGKHCFVPPNISSRAARRANGHCLVDGKLGHGRSLDVVWKLWRTGRKHAIAAVTGRPTVNDQRPFTSYSPVSNDSI